MKKNTKRWLTLGLSSLLLLAGGSLTQNNHVSANQINRNQKPVTTLAKEPKQANRINKTQQPVTTLVKRPKRKIYHPIGRYSNYYRYLVGSGQNRNYKAYYYYLTNHQVNNLYHYRNADFFVQSGSYLSMFHETFIRNQVPRMHITRHLNLNGKELYHVYGNNSKVRNVWVLGQMLSKHRKTIYYHNHVSPLLKDKYRFFNSEEDRYAKHYLTKKQYRRDRYLKRTYDNLDKRHDYSGRNVKRYNHDFGLWLNFYRSIHHLPEVSYSPYHARLAKEDLLQDTDPNVADDVAVPSSVENYMMDSNNADNDGTSGHRDMVLDPATSTYGAYIVPNGGNYYSSGISFGNNTSRPYNYTVVYPNDGVSSLADAYFGEYWTCALPIVYTTNISTPHVSVYDTTGHQRVKVSNVHIAGSEIYYNVDVRKLHLFHTYRIKIWGGYVPNLNYKTTLGDFGAFEGFQGYYY